MKKSQTTSPLAYYVALWAITLATFFILDFSKRVDDVLLGLSGPELATNLFIVFSLVWPLTLGLGWLSALTERAGYPRVAHFPIVMAFVTANVWSLKVGLAVTLSRSLPPYRATAAYLVLALALVLSIWITTRARKHLTLVEKEKGRILSWLALLWLLCAIGFLVPAPGGLQAPSRAPNLILVTFDGLSAANMSLYGYSRQTTPNIDKLAQESWVFDDFRANYTFTPPCLKSLNGNLQQPGASSGNLGLFEILRTSGYPHRAYFSYYPPKAYFEEKLSGAITRSGKSRAVYRALNQVFSQASLVWLSALLSEEPANFWPYHGDYDDDVFWTSNHYPAEHSFEAALSYLDSHPKGAFVWVHLWEPHYPYWADQDLRGKFGPGEMTPPEFINRPYSSGREDWVEHLRDRYDETVLTADRKFGRFLQELKARGHFDNSLLIVAADHGESLGNGFVGHSGASVLEPITHVPLIIHMPGNQKGLRIGTRASSIDLAPTVLQLLDLGKVDTLPGESLVPYILDPTKKSERLRFTVSSSAIQGMPGQIAVYWKNYKAVYLNVNRRNVQLFDLTNDPQTKTDLAKERPEIVEKIMKEAEVW